jgi:hypothetical protein
MTVSADSVKNRYYQKTADLLEHSKQEVNFGPGGKRLPVWGNVNPS